jgi:alpha/beta superfamily hydrolase
MLQGQVGAIECLIDRPAQLASVAPAQGWAIICHPHPLFGGTMDNKVVQTLARAYVQCGWSVLRFNFRGVGKSEGLHDNGVGEKADLLSIIEQIVPNGPISLSGFSFGAFVASHAVEHLHHTGRAVPQSNEQCDLRRIVLVGTATTRFDVRPIPAVLHDKTLLIHGEQDDTVPLSSVMDWARPQVLPISVIPGVGHFFHGQLPLLKSLVVRHLSS